MITRTGIVGCASAKLFRPAPARELYTSQLFPKASFYAEATCERWYILSAKHGLVHPDTVLELYDVKLGRSHRDPAKDPPTVGVWNDLVIPPLREALAGVPQPSTLRLESHEPTAERNCPQESVSRYETGRESIRHLW